MKTQDKCPECNRKIDLDKSYSQFQKWKNKMAMNMTKKVMGKDIKDIPEMKDYYCDCGLHITFIKNEDKWVWVSAS